MMYISGYKNKSFKVCNSKDGRSKSYSYDELVKIIKSKAIEIYGITDTVWFVPVSNIKNGNTEIVYTFDIINITDKWRDLIPDIEDDCFKVDVTVDNCRVTSVEFYYIYKSNDIIDITNKIDKYYINYVQFYGIGLYQRQPKNYELKARQFAEKHGIIEYTIKGNEMKYNVSFPKYLNNPHYTIQHIVNLDTGKEQTKQLKRFDSKGLVNRS